MRSLISNEELRVRLNDTEDIVLIDVREREEFANERLEGAQNAPLETLSETLDALSPDQTIVFICKTGQRSGQACTFARSIGFANVFSLEGGMTAWVS